MQHKLCFVVWCPGFFNFLLYLHYVVTIFKFIQKNDYKLIYNLPLYGYPVISFVIMQVVSNFLQLYTMLEWTSVFLSLIFDKSEC